MPNNTRVFGLQVDFALRGLAALAVVATHARFEFQNTALWPIVDPWLRPGESGVDLFFVISGFIMAHTTRGAGGGPPAAASFAIRRIARVWPAYIVATLLRAP